MKLTIDDVYRARAFLRDQHQTPVRIIAGPVAWVHLVRSTKRDAIGMAVALVGHEMTLFGLPVIEDQTRHPDYLAVEYANGARLPVAEV